MILKARKRKLEQEELSLRQNIKELNDSSKGDSLTKFVTPAFSSFIIVVVYHLCLSVFRYKEYLKAEQQTLLQAGVTVCSRLMSFVYSFHRCLGTT